MKNDYSDQDQKRLRLVGERIRAIRLSKAMSQEQLAELAEINSKYLSDIECGKRNLALINLFRLGRALKVHPREFIDFEDWQNQND